MKSLLVKSLQSKDDLKDEGRVRLYLTPTYLSTFVLLYLCLVDRSSHIW